jgi:hypothetical protein
MAEAYTENNRAPNRVFHVWMIMETGVRRSLSLTPAWRLCMPLGRLAEHSLLVLVTRAEGTSYHALEPVRQFALTRLDAAADDQARPRHLAWCLSTAAELDGADPAARG